MDKNVMKNLIDDLSIRLQKLVINGDEVLVACAGYRAENFEKMSGAAFAVILGLIR